MSLLAGSSTDYNRRLRMRNVQIQLRKRQADVIDGFENKGILNQFGCSALIEVVCTDPRFPCIGMHIVNLYARMGLHRYYLLQGKHYQFLRVEKYNVSKNFGPNDYYITSAVMDPANGAIQFFQSEIDETIRSRGRLDLTCCVAVLRGDPNMFPPKSFEHDDNLPELPTENPFRDTNRFYLVKKSELEDNANDWIRLYLELAVARKCRMFIKGEDLSNLEIVKVALQKTSSQDPNEGHFNAKNTTVYISYRDTSEARVGKDVDRIAVVRRSFDEQSSCFSLVGHNQSLETIREVWFGNDVDRIAIAGRSFHEQEACFTHVSQNQSSEIIPKKGKSPSASGQRLGVHKPWLLSIPKMRKAYQNSGIRMARLRHK
ncbi:hypothetical protein CARUB_v10009487mg [Capsella rubella]|uniref:Uncharacterized protein n=1 Tax=Capsella rubella TaxID=81985 RepID=R0GQI9_9BRAS|nr:UPF0725 protein EMB2204 [Capsella rubella]EOA38016.1 hypothetical protein CARUB_v10009487mg [Capsella rubella]